MDSFPSPVLAAAADVAKLVDGDDSLPVLWTIFTKCKESLQDGRRLENISWRLWYQSMVAANLSPASDLLETPLDTCSFVSNEKPYRPLTPDELPRRTFTTDSPSNVPLSSHGMANPLHTPPLDEQSTGPSSVASSLPNYFYHKPFSPSSRRNSFRKGSSPINVGKILYELLPSATVPSLVSLGSVLGNASTLESPTTHYGNMRVLPTVSLPLSSPLSHFVASIRYTIASAKEAAGPPQSLPTPEAEEGNPSLDPGLLKHFAAGASAMVPVIMTDNSSPGSKHDDISSTAHEHPLPPLLVVVKPTPDPTPHPTPPATPVQRLSVLSQEEDANASSSGPRLHVPGLGQDALLLVQTRASSCSQLQLPAFLVMTDGDGNPPTSDANPASVRNYDSNQRLAMVLPLPTSVEPECVAYCVSNRQSISSDTTSSSSRRSSFTPSEFSKATTATTVSEPYQYPHRIEKRPSSSASSPPHNQVTADSGTGLLPTSPLYESELASSALKRRKEKDTSLESTSGKLSGSSTSKALGSVTSNKGSSSSFRSVNTARKHGNSGNNKNGNEVSASTAAYRSRMAKSRSRSRTREAGNASTLHALVMTRAAASGRGVSGKVPVRARNGGVTRRGKGGVAKVNMSEVAREGSVMFNFGPASEEGLKSTGSGSEVTGNSVQNDREVAQVMQNSSSQKGTSANVPAPPAGEEKASVVLTEKGKGKGKEKAKSGVTTSVEATIADPLLPGSVRRQIVLTSDDDSEGFETETDSWSDTESADAPTTTQQRSHTEVEQSHAPHQPAPHHQPQQHQQQRPQQQRQQHRPLPVRTHSDQFSRNVRPVSRAHQRLAEQRAAEDRKWKEDMFVKLPKSSFENLAKVNRTLSAGLLSQLLKPELVASADQNCRRGFSSGVIQPLRPFTVMAQPPQQPQRIDHQNLPVVLDAPQPPQPPSQLPAQPPSQLPAQPPSQLPAQPPSQLHSQHSPAAADRDARPGQHSRQASRTYQLPKRLAALTNPSVVAPKTPVASAVMSELRVGSINGVKQVTTGGISVNGNTAKYKPKGRPPETVMEDSSDSEADDNQLGLPKSVAQEKLRALLEAKKLKKSAQAADTNFFTVLGNSNSERQVSSQPVEPISIPPPRLLYPYNLPPPNPPTTPRTTRRKMLAVEIPESLRRNLLWERQVSQAHARGLGRRRSMNDVKGWHIPNLVKLTPKGVKQDEVKDIQKERDRRYLARTRSWAFQYHAVGW